MQQPTNSLLTTYGILALSAITIIALSVFFILHDIAWDVWAGLTVGILTANGLVGVTRWQVTTQVNQLLRAPQYPRRQVRYPDGIARQPTADE